MMIKWRRRIMRRKMMMRVRRMSSHYGSEWQKSGKKIKKNQSASISIKFHRFVPHYLPNKKPKRFFYRIISSNWKLALKSSHYTQISQIDKIYLIEFVIFPHSTGSGFFSGEFGQKFSVISDHIYIKEQKYINQSLAQLGTNFSQQYIWKN